jgi:hypothetical protein
MQNEGAKEINESFLSLFFGKISQKGFILDIIGAILLYYWVFF